MLNLFNRISIVSLMTILFLALTMSSCKKEDPIPTITELKVCDSAPSGEILCSSNRANFEMTSPGFYSSAIFRDIDKDTPVSFTLFGKDNAGNWVELFKKSFRPSEIGTFDNENVFNLGYQFTKSSTQLWPVAEYQVEARIELSEGAVSVKTFNVQ